MTADRQPHPLWISAGLAGEHYRKTCVAFGNGEATMTALVEAAEKLRALQLQWKHHQASQHSGGTPDVPVSRNFRRPQDLARPRFDDTGSS